MDSYPAGVTDTDIETQYETELDERNREMIEQILRRHVRWEEYLATADRGDREDLILEILDDVYEVCDIDRYELFERAERLRRRTS